jgi:predicted nuclease of restriction endonuclease-like (RecB) superfamily
VNALRAQLSWTHLRSLIVIDDPIKREFYTELAKLEGWSTRQLTERIKSMMFERTAISKKPEQTISNDLQELRTDGKLSADLAFRDPYVLDFLGLADSYSERDLESSILAELQRFIAELGTDFAFVARQKRITIDQRDYYLDLLFFHRRLKCLVVIDLKIGEFQAGFKGQMELYLRYLEKYEMVEGESHGMQQGQHLLRIQSISCSQKCADISKNHSTWLFCSTVKFCLFCSEVRETISAMSLIS